MIASVRETTRARFLQHWITALLVGAVVLTWLSLLSTADRLRGADTLIVVALGALLYGSLLAASRFPARTAWVIDLFTSLGLAILIVGRVLPEPAVLFGQVFDKSLWLMNARLATLGEVLRSDTQWLLTNYFPQTRLCLFVAIIAVWNAVVWLMWSVLRQRRALRGVLPLALLGVLATSLSKDGPQLSVLFIAACVLLVARTAYTYQLRDWQFRDVGYPDLIGEDWASWAAILAAAVVLMAGISTPEWHSALQRAIDSLRPRAPLPAQTTAPPLVNPVVGNNFAPSFVPSLNVIGDSFPVSDQTVFYVTTDDVPDGIDSTGRAMPPKQRHYWRGAIFDRYTGTGWEPLTVDVEAPPVTQSADEASRIALHQQFDVLSLQDDHLFAAGQPVKASAGVILEAAQDDVTAVLPRGRSAQYEITSWVPQVTAQELEAASTAYPMEIRARYLLLPETVPQRVKDLAARLTRGATSPYDKAIRLQEYLRVTYPYRPDVPPPPPGRDVADYFLFDAPGGFCSYYATAMTVMLRSQGVPARVVTGFATGEYDSLQRKYRVPAKAAHAWVEVYFPEYGWIEFEPTSSQSVFDYTSAATTPPDQLPELLPPRSVDSSSTPIAFGIIGAVLLGCIGVAGYAWWLRHTRLHLTPEGQARRLYWETRRSLQHLGVEVAPNTTPLEYRAACADRLADQPRLQNAIEVVIDSYIRATYTATPPDRSEVVTARRVWRATWRRRLSLRLRLHARHLRSLPRQAGQRDT